MKGCRLLGVAALLLSIIFAVKALDGNPYKILGVRSTATTEEIKKAYKKLAMIWHPDKNSSPEANGKFQEIAAARDLLLDDEKRRMYDQGRGPSFGSGTGGQYRAPRNDENDVVNIEFLKGALKHIVKETSVANVVGQ